LISFWFLLFAEQSFAAEGPQHFERPPIHCSFTFSKETPASASRYPDWVQRIAHRPYKSIPVIDRKDIQNIQIYIPKSNGIVNKGIEVGTYLGFPILIKYFSDDHPNEFLTWLNKDERITYRKRKILIEYQWLKILQHLRIGPVVSGIVNDPLQNRVGIVMQFLPGIFMKDVTMSLSKISDKASENVQKIQDTLHKEGIIPKDFQFIVMKYDRVLVIDPAFFQFEDPMDPGVLPMNLHYDSK
jgi:hypothetical protein